MIDPSSLLIPDDVDDYILAFDNCTKATEILQTVHSDLSFLCGMKDNNQIIMKRMQKNKDDTSENSMTISCDDICGVTNYEYNIYTKDFEVMVDKITTFYGYCDKHVFIRRSELVEKNRNFSRKDGAEPINDSLKREYFNKMIEEWNKRNDKFQYNYKHMDEALNYIWYDKKSCSETNKDLKFANPDLEIICNYDILRRISEISDNFSTVATAIKNGINQYTGDVTYISLNKLNQLPRYKYDVDEGFSNDGNVKENNTGFIKRDDMKNKVLSWVKTQPTVSDVNKKQHYINICDKRYKSKNIVSSLAMGGKRSSRISSKQTKKKNKSMKRTKRMRGTRKRNHKKR
jgi:hypothetical protein